MKERRHLRRLTRVYQSQPRYFITVCVRGRRPILVRSEIHEILREQWAKSYGLHGWAIGSYVVMPDHVHFFCVDVESRIPLSKMIGSWKQWSSKEACRLLKTDAPFWQKEFFDHLLRSDESYSEKWDYVRYNPVRAGLVEDVADWKYSGHVHYL